MVARDIIDPAEMDLNTVYAALKGTTKHLGTSFTEAEFMPDIIAMLHDIAGGEAAWRARPFVSNSNCFVVPPLRFATESCLVMEVAVNAGMPVLLLSAGQAGATAPASIAGAVAQAVAEVLAGLVYVNAMSPGHPCVAGAWPFVSDLAGAHAHRGYVWRVWRAGITYRRLCPDAKSFWATVRLGGRHGRCQNARCPVWL